MCHHNFFISFREGKTVDRLKWKYRFAIHYLLRNEVNGKYVVVGISFDILGTSLYNAFAVCCSAK